MFKYSKKSADILITCHSKIQEVFNECIKYYDMSVICGHRTSRQQSNLFQIGRRLSENDIWIVNNPKAIVTNCDGYKKLSKHNECPSFAIDVIPYPSGYKDEKEFHCMAGVILTIAKQKNIEMEWGGHWKNFKDLPHFQVKV